MPNRRAEIVLTPEEEREYLEQSYTLQVASIGPKGYPHLVAMWYAVIDGAVHFSTRSKSQKVLNLRRNPKISVMLESGRAYNELKGLVIEGEAEIVEEPEDVVRVLAAVAAKYGGGGRPSQPATDLTSFMAEARKRVAIRVRPVDVYSWDHAKLGR